MNPEHAQNPQLSDFRIMVLEPSIQWLVRVSGDDLRPYPPLGQLGIECGPIGLRICKGCWTEDVRQLPRAQPHGVAATCPEEVPVMYQGSQLIDALAQSFIRPKLSEQRNYLAQHEETVSIAGVVARLVERGLNNWESALGGGLEHEIERGRTNLLHGWKSSRE
jgi:hypothetical protein